MVADVELSSVNFKSILYYYTIIFTVFTCAAMSVLSVELTIHSSIEV